MNEDDKEPASLRSLLKGIVDAPLIDTPSKKAAAVLLILMALAVIVCLGVSRFSSPTM